MNHRVFLLKKRGFLFSSRRIELEWRQREGGWFDQRDLENREDARFYLIRLSFFSRSTTIDFVPPYLFVLLYLFCCFLHCALFHSLSALFSLCLSCLIGDSAVMSFVTQLISLHHTTHSPITVMFLKIKTFKKTSTPLLLVLSKWSREMIKRNEYFWVLKYHPSIEIKWISQHFVQINTKQYTYT